MCSMGRDVMLKWKGRQAHQSPTNTLLNALAGCGNNFKVWQHLPAQTASHWWARSSRCNSEGTRVVNICEYTRLSQRWPLHFPDRM